MICENSLPKIYEEVVNTTFYILNICLVKPILTKTPYELFKAKKPNTLYFKVFRRTNFIYKNGREFS